MFGDLLSGQAKIAVCIMAFRSLLSRGMFGLYKSVQFLTPGYGRLSHSCHAPLLLRSFPYSMIMPPPYFTIGIVFARQ